MRYILVLLVALHIAYAKEIPSYAKEWQGIYEFTQKTSKQAFKISDNCFDDEDMGGFVCEIGYSKNNSAFNDFAINFYTEKPNDMNYSIVRIISLQSPTKATIKVFSMEYNNDFCNIEVIRQGQMITLISGSCKIEDFTLHKDIFASYNKVQGYARADSVYTPTQQTHKIQSSLYKKWKQQWGDYQWSNNAIGNKSYAFETTYIIIEMIDKGDIDGLSYLYQTLQKDKEHNMAFLNGIIGEPTFEKKAIDKANFEALEFLLKNNVIDIDTTITDDALQEYSLPTYATQKLQEAKTKGDSKAVENYEKIIEVLKQYQNAN